MCSLQYLTFLINVLLLRSSMLLQESGVCSFLLLVVTHCMDILAVGLSSHLMMGIWVVSNF